MILNQKEIYDCFKLIVDYNFFSNEKIVYSFSNQVRLSNEAIIIMFHDDLDDHEKDRFQADEIECWSNEGEWFLGKYKIKYFLEEMISYLEKTDKKELLAEIKKIHSKY